MIIVRPNSVILILKFYLFWHRDGSSIEILFSKGCWIVDRNLLWSWRSSMLVLNTWINLLEKHPPWGMKASPEGRASKVTPCAKEAQKWPEESDKREGWQHLTAWNHHRWLMSSQLTLQLLLKTKLATFGLIKRRRASCSTRRDDLFWLTLKIAKLTLG